MTKRFLAGVVLFGALLAVSSLQAHHSLAGRVRPEQSRAGDRRGSEVCVYEPARSAAYRNQERGGRGQGVAADDGLGQRPDNAGIIRHRPESDQARR